MGVKLSALPVLGLIIIVAACRYRDNRAVVVAETGAATPASQAPPPSGIVRTLTYNVAGLLQGISQSQPITNTPLISPKLNGYDLVLVQEDFFYHDLLAAQAAHPYRSQPLTRYSTLAGDGLNRFSASPFVDFQREQWTVCNGYLNAANDCLSSKGFSFARHTLDARVEIDVYNLHADAGRAPGDEAARSTQFQQLAAFIQARSTGRALIVGGDTNLLGGDPDDEAVLAAFVQATGLADAARFLGGKAEKLDRLFFRSGADVALRPVQWREAAEFVDAAGAPLSDHEAIHVDFRWIKTR